MFIFHFFTFKDSISYIVANKAIFCTYDATIILSFGSYYFFIIEKDVRTEGKVMNNKVNSVSIKTVISNFFLRLSADRHHIFSAVAAFFLGMCTLIEGINPFGLAMLTAASRRVEAFFIGSALSSVFAGPMTLPTLAANILVYIIRRISEKEKIMLPKQRLVLATFTAAFLGVIRFMLGNRQFYTITEAIVFYAALPLFSVLYMGLEKRDAFLGKWHREAGLLAAAFTLTLVMSSVTYGYFSLGVIWAFVLTMFAAKRGMAAGCVTGFVCGLGCYEPMHLPLFGLAGLSAGLLMERNKKAALFFGAATAIAFTTATAQLDKLLLTALCIALGAALFWLADRAGLDRFIDGGEKAVKVRPQEETDPKFAKIAEAFSSLANVFFNNCEAVKEQTVKISIPLEQCKKCPGCSAYGLDEAENNIKLSKIVKGERSAMPHYFMELCPNAQTIEEEAKSAGNIGGNEQLRRIAEQYLDFAKILECVAEKEKAAAEPMPEKEQRVCEALNELGINYGKVSVIGGRSRVLHVYDVLPSSIKCTTNSLRLRLSRAVGTMLGDPQFITVDDMYVMRFDTIPAIQVEYAQTSAAASGERVNGDTVNVFESVDNVFYALISDGMGSGPAAASSSRLTGVFLEKLLQMGADRSESIRLLNKLLIAKEGETFAGVDLVEVDRLTATASVTKAGAAPTLLIRDGEAHLINSDTPPVGIIDDIVAEKTSFRLKRQDWILMFSDGVIGGSDKIPVWMLKIIESKNYSSPGELAMKINEGAKRAYGLRDDITTLAMRIS